MRLKRISDGKKEKDRTDADLKENAELPGKKRERRSDLKIAE